VRIPTVSTYRSAAILRHAGLPTPHISDDIGIWLPARAVATLRAHCNATLADLTVRIPRRRQQWKVSRVRPSQCAAHPGVLRRASGAYGTGEDAHRRLADHGIVPWE
jgi:hypothetical protein